MRLVVLGEQLVDALAGRPEDVLGALDLGGTAGLRHLPRRREHLVDELAQIDEVVVERLRGRLPWNRWPLGGRRATVVGEREDAPPGFGGGRLDQALVLELLERGVDGARARRPVAATALGDHLDDLVAVHRLLGEEREDGGADVAAARAAPGAEERVAAEAAAAVPVASAPVAPRASPVMNQMFTGASCRQRPAWADCDGSHVVPFYRVPSRYIVKQSLVKADNRPAG